MKLKFEKQRERDFYRLTKEPRVLQPLPGLWRHLLVSMLGQAAWKSSPFAAAASTGAVLAAPGGE